MSLLRKINVDGEVYEFGVDDIVESVEKSATNAENSAVRAEEAANFVEDVMNHVGYYGVIRFSDDGLGNVTASLTGTGGVNTTDDGNGNVTLEVI